MAPSAMVDRVASVLGVFDGEGRLSLAQVSERSGLPRSSAHRILQRLVELGWVERTDAGYQLGLRMFELGTWAVRSDRLRSAAPPMMARLHRATGLAVHLAVLDGDDIVVVDQVAGQQGRSADWAAGTRMAAVHCAPGWSLLASIGAVRPADEVLPAPPTRFGVRSQADLARVLAGARERGGTAVDLQTCMPGVTVVSVPIGPVPAESRTALAVSGAGSGFPVDAVLPVLRSAAHEVWNAAAGMVRHRHSRSVGPLSLVPGGSLAV